MLVGFAGREKGGIHFAIHLRLTQHCILTIFQFKSFIKKIKGGKVKGSEFAFISMGWGEMGRKTPPLPPPLV